jgi:hypothetical protein
MNGVPTHNFSGDRHRWGLSSGASCRSATVTPLAANSSITLSKYVGSGYPKLKIYENIYQSKIMIEIV